MSIKNQTNDKLRTKKKIYVQFIIVLVIGLVIYLRMITNSGFTEREAINYYRYTPNVYRLQLQVILLISNVSKLSILFFGLWWAVQLWVPVFLTLYIKNYDLNEITN